MGVPAVTCRAKPSQSAFPQGHLVFWPQWLTHLMAACCDLRWQGCTPPQDGLGHVCATRPCPLWRGCRHHHRVACRDELFQLACFLALWMKLLVVSARTWLEGLLPCLSRAC